MRICISLLAGFEIRKVCGNLAISLLREGKSQKGSTMVLVVAFLPIMLLLMGLSIDAGRILAAKAELYKASDVAARELAEEIDTREASETGQTTNRSTDEDAATWVEKNLDGMCGAELLNVEVVNTEAYVEVKSRAEVPLLFSGLVNRRSIIIEVTGLGRLKIYRLAV